MKKADASGKPANFYSRPCGRGDGRSCAKCRASIMNFYSRPCGRGDHFEREEAMQWAISTHAPAGGATRQTSEIAQRLIPFLLTPLREGRRL